MLNVTLKEFDYVGPEEMDEYESLFSGKGILKSVYETGDTIITLSAIGTNNEAVITVSQILKSAPVTAGSASVIFASSEFAVGLSAIVAILIFDLSLSERSL